MRRNWNNRVTAHALRGASVAALFLAAPSCGAALAQTASASGSDASSVETVVVTSTRVVRDGYSAPTPTSVVGLEDIMARNPANIADLVNTMPAVTASTTPQTQNAGGGPGVGENVLNLRNLGVNRTLVLLDGERITPNTATGNIDVNLLPTTLVQRVDVVTGGASADWGSDAVAGVVNFVLDKNFNGLKGNIQGGETGYGDGRTIQGSLTYGTPFAGDKAHFEISVQYLTQGGIAGAAVTGRSWFQGYKVIANPNGSATDVILPNVGLSSGTAGGLITAGPLKGTQFVGATGTPAPFSFGFVSGLQSVNGTAEDDGGLIQLQDPQQEGSGFARFSYDLTPDVTLYAQGEYASSHLVGQGVSFNRFGNLTINSGNPYIPASVQSQMTALGIASFAFGTTNAALGFDEYHNNSQTGSFEVGAEGALGGDWHWNAHYQHGRFDETSLTENDSIIANYNLALNAVINPATGAVVCASTLTNPANGCAPIDAFGTGQVTQAAKNFVTGTSVYNLGTSQDNAVANIQGTPFSVPAGPVSVAAGFEYRREHYDVTSSALDAASAFFVGDALPASGGFDVKEGFAEAVVPILSGLDLVKDLDFNGAIRETGYSVSGNVTTWKLGLTYDINDELRLRTTRSTDIRAPNLQDLFATGLTNVTALSDPGNGSYQIPQITSGNVKLTPEVANTVSGGLVYQPAWLAGLNLSIDYYGVRIHNAIVSLTGQQVINQCAAGFSSACSLITRGSNGLITTVHVSPANVQSESTSGFDIALNYRADASVVDSSWDGTIALSAMINDTMDHTISALGQTLQYAGTNGDGSFASPRWRGILSGTYELGPVSATVTTRFIGSGVVSNRTPVILNNSVPAIAYLDLSGSYKIFDDAQVYFAVQNLLDQDPPATPQVISVPHLNIGADDYIYDVLGRQFRLGVRFQL